MRPAAIGGTLLLLAGILADGLPHAIWANARAAPQAQANQPDSLPTRSTSKPTARIRGRVIVADSLLPIAGAQMDLIPVPFNRDRRAYGITDAQGRYEFPDLYPGRYTLSAAKGGLVKLTYPQRIGNEASAPIDVAEGQTIDRVDFALPRGGVIVVTVVDPAGDPVAQVSIAASRGRPVAGVPQTPSTTQAFATTNDLGQGRVFGLPPGDYYLTARSTALALLGSSNPNGPPQSYYPGTLVASEAQRVAVTAEQEVSITMPLLDGAPVTISGNVHHSDGSPVVPTNSPANSLGRGGGRGTSPPGYRVFLQAEQPPGSDVGPPTFTIPVEADGSFALGGVAPGRYNLLVNQPNDTAAPDAEYARVAVTVGVSDIAGITVVTQKGATVHGRVLFDTGQPPSTLQPRMFYLRTYATGSTAAVNIGRTTMANDWTFDVTGIVATGLLRPDASTSQRNGWWVKSVLINGKDYAETPFAFEPGREYRDVQVTLTQNRATVTGSVVDAQARPTGAYAVVLFPEDRALWFPQSLLMLAAQPDPRGRFTIGTLPAGRFLITAVPHLEAGQEKDVELLEKLASRATRVTLGEGETRTVNLRLVSLP